MISLIRTALLFSRTVLAMVDVFPTAQEKVLFFVHSLLLKFIYLVGWWVAGASQGKRSGIE
jgi:hypothetical protein